MQSWDFSPKSWGFSQQSWEFLPKSWELSRQSGNVSKNLLSSYRLESNLSSPDFWAPAEAAHSPLTNHSPLTSQSPLTNLEAIMSAAPPSGSSTPIWFVEMPRVIHPLSTGEGGSAGVYP